MNLQPASTRVLASSRETSFCVADGRATSTLPTTVHGRAPSMYLNLSLYLSSVVSSVSCLRATFSEAM